MVPDDQGPRLDILNAILAEGNLACVVIDRELRVVDLYDPGGALRRCELGGALDQPLLDLAPELVGREAELMDLALGRLDRLEIPIFSRADAVGRPRYCRMLLKPRPATAGILLLVEDVSAMGEMQQRLMQSRNELRLLADAVDKRNRDLVAANLELRKLADVKTTFVSMAAHELRTPLAVMRGYADMLLEEAVGAINSAQRESLLTLRRGADRLLEVVNNLLDLTRLEAGRMELVMQPQDLAALVRAAAREFRPLFDSACQRFDVVVAPDLPAVLADETRVFQILSNLLSNASKYTPAGGLIELRAALAESPGELEVSVRDTGVGIPADEQDRLGSLFFRARTANQIDARGVGLGLYITNSLVQLHGGRLWFESQEGVGSTFHATFLLANAL